MKKQRLYYLQFVLPLVSFCLMLLLWQLVVVLGGYQKFLLPQPGDVAKVFFEKPGTLLMISLRTGTAALAGFWVAVIFGVFTALVFSQSQWIRLAGYPYAIFFQTVPIVAIAPLIINFFGYGLPSVIVVASIISLFPIITTTTTGLLAVDKNLLELFQLNRASRWQILWKLQFPGALRYLMAGMKTSSGLAVVGAIVGEFFVGYTVEDYGLGFYIRLCSDRSLTSELFAAMICSTLLGVLVFVAISLTQQFVLKRYLS